MPLISPRGVWRRRASSKPAAFSREEESRLKKHLAPQAAVALQTNRWHELRDQSRVDQLKALAASLVGGGNFEQILSQVISTTAELLETQAASLYLYDENAKKLNPRRMANTCPCSSRRLNIPLDEKTAEG
jgi:hypothetical protein